MHGPIPHSHSQVEKNIAWAFGLNLSLCCIEFFMAAKLGSLAILSNGIHDLGDSASLGFAWFLERWAKQGRDDKFNFGYRRLSLLSSLVMALIVITGCLYVLSESYEHFQNPNPIHGWQMSILAIFGLSVNIFAARKLSGGKTQNEKILTWHMIEDVFSWFAILVGSIGIAAFKWYWLDPFLAAGLSFFIIWNVSKGLRKSLYYFLQGYPETFLLDDFRSKVLKLEHVQKIENVSVWSLDGAEHVLSCIVFIEPHLSIAKSKEIIRQIKHIARHAGATHATIEIDTI